MACSRCGQVNATGAAYCVRCGQALAAAPVPQSASLPSSPSSAMPPNMPAFPAYAPPAAPSSIPFQPPSGSAGGVMPAYAGASAHVPPGPAPAAPPTPKRRGKATGNFVRALPGVTYACRLCGNPVFATRRICEVCEAPHGMIANSGDPTGGTYLLIDSLYAMPSDAIEAAPVRPLPATLARLRWNWGAFGASTPWLFAHRLGGWGCIALGFTLLAPLSSYGALYLLLPACGILVSLLVGLQGHSLAWQNSRYDSPEAYLRSETRWKWLGILGTLVKAFAVIALLLNVLNHK